MGAYKYMKKTYQEELRERSELLKDKVFRWRRGPVVQGVERPSNLVRARTLGYKAKEGYVVARVRVGKGRRRRRTSGKGRKPAHAYLYVQPGSSLRTQAEQKANRKYSNLEVLNSYLAGEDGNYKFFEVLLVDTRRNSEVKLNKRRAYRGMSSSGKKTRGLRAKGRKAQRKGSKNKKERNQNKSRRYRKR